MAHLTLSQQEEYLQGLPSLIKRLSIRFHLLLCGACRRELQANRQNLAMLQSFRRYYLSMTQQQNPSPKSSDECL